MCGIFGIIGQKPNAAEVIFESLKSLEYRGYDSWGVAVIPMSNAKFPISNKIVIKKRVGKIGNANVDDLPQAKIGFGHTRWATHGGVTQANAHPHPDCSGKIAVIHNGIVENYQKLKQQYLNNHKFASQTDSEVISHLIEKFSQKINFPDAVKKTFNLLKGSNAFIVINADFPEMIAVRNGSPLILGMGKNEKILASDTSAILPYTKKIYYLKDFEMAVVSQNKISIINCQTGKSIIPKFQTSKLQIENTVLGNYPNFMFKEICEQPEIIQTIAASDFNQINKLAHIIKKSFGTYLIGCGSAGYAALSGSYLFSKIAKRHINCAIGSEFGYHLEFLTGKSLVIALSQSGETMDILESVKKAKAKRAKIMAIVNVPGSSLDRLSDYRLYINAGIEKAVASTKAFIGKIADLILLAYAVKGELATGQKLLNIASVEIKKLITKNNLLKIRKLARKLKNKQHLYIIGRGLSYPASMETTMKIKEISYIHAEGFAAGELKHGTMALIEKNTPCLVFIPNDETYGDTLAAAMEMKARGGTIIGVTYQNHEIFDEFIQVSDCHEATILANVVVGQILAYYLAMEKKLDPDKPRNLAKSVTVK